MSAEALAKYLQIESLCRYFVFDENKHRQIKAFFHPDLEKLFLELSSIERVTIQNSARKIYHDEYEKDYPFVPVEPTLPFEPKEFFMSEQKSILDNMQVKEQGFPLKSNTVHKLVVGHCPKCGGPIYGPKEITSTKELDTTYSCECRLTNKPKSLEDLTFIK